MVTSCLRILGGTLRLVMCWLRVVASGYRLLWVEIYWGKINPWTIVRKVLTCEKCTSPLFSLTLTRVCESLRPGTSYLRTSASYLLIDAWLRVSDSQCLVRQIHECGVSIDVFASHSTRSSLFPESLLTYPSDLSKICKKSCIHEKAFENVVLRWKTILFRLQYSTDIWHNDKAIIT